MVNKLSLLLIVFGAFIVVTGASPALAQTPVTVNTNQSALLASDDPQLAANKKLVYDFRREVFNGGTASKIPQFVAKDFIQHNPTIPSGIQAFMAFMADRASGGNTTPPTIPDLVSIVAENDIVVVAFRREMADPRNPGQTYTTTWFDMFRIEDNMIAEHWDYGTINP